MAGCLGTACFQRLAKPGSTESIMVSQTVNIHFMTLFIIIIYIKLFNTLFVICFQRFNLLFRLNCLADVA